MRCLLRFLFDLLSTKKCAEMDVLQLYCSVFQRKCIVKFLLYILVAQVLTQYPALENSVADPYQKKTSILSSIPNDIRYVSASSCVFSKINAMTLRTIQTAV